jgi:hypothetical protein
MCQGYENAQLPDMIRTGPDNWEVSWYEEVAWQWLRSELGKTRSQV